jgi:hypothetical protein
MKKLLTILTILVLSAGMTARVFAQSCPTPTALTSSNVTETSASLSWTSALTSSYSIIEFRAQGSPNWISQIVQAIPYTLQNLPCATTIEWRVQAACIINGTAQFSPFSGVETFTTLTCTSVCPVPNNLNVSNVTATSVLLNWTAPSGVFMYNVRYQQAGSANFITINNINSTSHPLQNLTCNTPYVFQVQSVCMNNSTGTTTLSQWSPLYTFITSACSSSCPAPQNPVTTNISQTDAVLTWMAPSPNYTVFNVRYRVPGSLNWTVVNNVNTPYQLGNLTCGTTYEWEVQTVCPNSPGTATTSTWTSTISFTTAPCTTACTPPTLLTASNISQYGAVLSWTAAPAPAASYQIRYRLTGSASWIFIGNASNPYQLGNLTCNSGYEWQVRSVCPATLSNTVAYSPWSGTHIFNTAACTVACPAPLNPITTNISMMGAVLSWTAAAPAPVTYQIRYRESSATLWTTVNIATSPYQLGNLTCNTIYVWQVRTVCSNTAGGVTYSAWSPLITFVTLPCNAVCPTPFNLSSTNITLSGAVLSWSVTSPAVVGFQLRYRVTGSLAWTTLNSVSSPWQLGNLNCNTNYEWQVRTVCGVNSGTITYSPWSVMANFATLSCSAICPAPLNPNTSNVTLYSAQLNWTSPAPGLVTFEVRYRQSGTTTWTTVPVNDSPYALANLTCATGYEWQVRTVCGNSVSTSSFSAWSSTQVFTTLICNLTCPTPTNLTATNLTATGAVLSWTATAPGAVNYQLRYRVNGTTTWTLINSASSPWQLGGLTCNTSYQWQVRTVCPAAGLISYSPWSLLSNFTTTGCSSSPCPTPVGLLANVNSQGGLLTWGAVTGAQSYNVQWRPLNTTVWNTSSTPSAFLQIGGLTPGTVYEFQVQTLCVTLNGLTVLSPWSPSYIFTTPLLLTLYPNPASERVTISYHAEEAANAVVEVRDMFGKSVAVNDKVTAEGTNEWNLDVSTLREGWYSVTVKTGVQMTTQKLFVGR